MPSDDGNKETIFFPTVAGLAVVMGWSHGDAALPPSALGHYCWPETSQPARAFAVLGAVARESPNFLGIIPGRSWNGVPSVPQGFLPIPADNASVACLLATTTVVPVLGAREFHSLQPTLGDYHGVEFDAVALTWRWTKNKTGKIVLRVPCALLTDSFNFSAVEDYLLKFLPLR